MTHAESVKQLNEFKEIFGEGKFGIITVFNPQAKMTKDDREFAANEVGQLAKGVAIITDSKMGKIAISMFLSIKKLNYPMRAFVDSASAINWLRTL